MMMFAALLLHLVAIPVLALQLLVAVPAEGWRHAWKRLPLFVLLWITFTLLTLLHVIGHLLDEFFFRGYRKITVRQPVFILGIPRSGTTYLQRLLSNEKCFTTFTTWETILAPSVTERHFFRLLGRLLDPLKNAVAAVRRKVFHTMDSIHRIGLREPEEDFLLLLPLLACFLLAFLCPRSGHYWRLGSFDRDTPAWYRKIVMAFYYRCLQKHLYFHGDDMRLLSKNPSFTSLGESLQETFRDARFIACTRHPAEVIPSQLSSLRPMMGLLGNGKLSPESQQKLIDILIHYYSLLARHLHSSRIELLPMTALRSEFRLSMTNLFAFLGLDTSERFEQVIEAAEAPCDHTSSHHYSLSEFSLSEQDIEKQFQDVWSVLAAATESGAS